MNNSPVFTIFTLRLHHERHVVQARQRTREIAALLGFEHQDQIRLATATSELARNAYRYASGGSVTFQVSDQSPQMFLICVSDTGPGIPNLDEILNGKYVSKTGLGRGLIGTKALMDHFKITSSSNGTGVEFGKVFSPLATRVDERKLKFITQALSKSGATDPFEELERQNQELLKTLAELREKQELLSQSHRELEDTNRGVVALYAELDQNANDLRRVSELKTRFLSNLTHEFRTPLNSITSLCRLLLDRSDGDLTVEQEKQAFYIQKSAAELSGLVNDLLDLAKVEAGKIDVIPRHFEVKDLFGALRGMLKPLLVGNSLDLIFESGEGIPPLYTDEGKISQVLRNLISNALKFTSRGHVRVIAEMEADSLVTFQVSDTGIGIRPEDQERIFEEFVQIESEMQSRVKGTGLGLPLAKRLTELMDGTIEVASELGVGSTFTVKLPIYIGDHEKPITPQPTISTQAPGTTILFLEDNRETRFVFASSLKNANYRLVFATNLPEARSLFLSAQPALVVLDRLIEDQDCLFFISELRSNGFKGPIVVVSVVDDAQGAVDAGASAFLTKPVPPFTLEITIRELIDGKPSKVVLLVDDDETSRYLMGAALSRLGCRVIEAHNGREGIRQAEKHAPNVIFLDVIMPDLTGFDVLREIRTNPLTTEISVIIHSSKVLTSQELRYMTEQKAFLYPKRTFDSDGSLENLVNVLSQAGIQL